MRTVLGGGSRRGVIPFTKLRQDYGDLYKPDTTDMGGGRGNGKNFDAELQESAYTEILSLDGGEHLPNA